ncbi:hypothetical protein AMATHDRAFT_8950 [Amanita thiersii Skay4041]|uniref:Uncharacterized protein n=1 Tax=Amanita thiersii Skay4041 TaxID=703135 RepID=A0A2A9N7R0_9AGAR|nr:hypothetical protein AMATHDRAFT_8950 [Amanita thiersii Skay4041]
MANGEIAIAVDKFISALADRYGTPMDVDRPEELSHINVPVTDTVYNNGYGYLNTVFCQSSPAPCDFTNSGIDIPDMAMEWEPSELINKVDDFFFNTNKALDNESWLNECNASQWNLDDSGFFLGDVSYLATAYPGQQAQQGTLGWESSVETSSQGSSSTGNGGAVVFQNECVQSVSDDLISYEEFVEEVERYASRQAQEVRQESHGELFAELFGDEDEEEDEVEFILG